MTLATNPKEQARWKQREQAAVCQRENDIRVVMSTPSGRRFIWRLANETCGVLSTTFTGDIQTYHREGRRSVGVELLAELQKLCPPEYVTMIQEAIAASQEDELHRANARETSLREDDE